MKESQAAHNTHTQSHTQPTTTPHTHTHTHIPMMDSSDEPRKVLFGKNKKRLDIKKLARELRTSRTKLSSVARARRRWAPKHVPTPEEPVLDIDMGYAAPEAALRAYRGVWDPHAHVWHGTGKAGPEAAAAITQVPEVAAGSGFLRGDGAEGGGVGTGVVGATLSHPLAQRDTATAEVDDNDADTAAAGPAYAVPAAPTAPVPPFVSFVALREQLYARRVGSSAGDASDEMLSELRKDIAALRGAFMEDLEKAVDKAARKVVPVPMREFVQLQPSLTGDLATVGSDELGGGASSSPSGTKSAAAMTGIMEMSLRSMMAFLAKVKSPPPPPPPPPTACSVECNSLTHNCCALPPTPTLGCEDPPCPVS